jgi:hypothetical protein
VQVREPLDGRDDGVPGGGEVQKVLLPRHVGLAGELGEHPRAGRARLALELLVLGGVVQDRTTVPHQHEVEPTHQGRRVHGVAERDIEVVPQLRGEPDVLVAIDPPSGGIGQIGDEQQTRAHARTLGAHPHPGPRTSGTRHA